MKNDRNLMLSKPLNFNDADSVASALAEWSQTLLSSGSEGNKLVGLFMKSEAVGFAAALADFNRQDKDANEFMSAVVQTWASILALLVAASANNVNGALSAVGRAFLETLKRVATENLENREVNPH